MWRVKLHNLRMRILPSGESVAVFSGFVGWVLLTWGISQHVGWTAWPLSGGLLLLVCGIGVRPLWRIVMSGVYGLNVR